MACDGATLQFLFSRSDVRLAYVSAAHTLAPSRPRPDDKQGHDERIEPITEIVIQAWLGIAEEAERLVAHAARGGKQDIYDQVAAKHGVTTATVKRAIGALNFVREAAPAAGLAVDKVTAGLSAIETIKRIRKLDSDTAAQYMRPALRGAVTYASLVALAKQLEVVANDSDEGRAEHGRLQVANFLAARQGQTKPPIFCHDSDPAKFLGLDVAYGRVPGSHSGTAAMCSPRWPISRCYGHPPGTALRTLCAAVLHFQSNYYVTDVPDERALFHDLMRHATGSAHCELVFIELSRIAPEL